jgi:hypothetical protein
MRRRYDNKHRYACLGKQATSTEALFTVLVQSMMAPICVQKLCMCCSGTSHDALMEAHL